MFVIPFRVSETSYSIMVVLEKANLERIREQDPAEVNLSKLGGEWDTLTLKDVIISYATQKDQRKVMELWQGGDVRGGFAMAVTGLRLPPGPGRSRRAVPFREDQAVGEAAVMDTDIRTAIWTARLLIAANLLCAVINIASHNYAVAFACLVWTGNCFVLAGAMRREARVRDEIRLLAAMHATITQEREEEES